MKITATQPSLWQISLQNLECTKQWDTALALMQNIIEQHPDSLDAYLAICYLLMNLLVEKDFDIAKHDYYAAQVLQYFTHARQQFSDNPAFLYYMGRIGVMSEWYFHLDIDEVIEMIKKAGELEPHNLVYTWDHYKTLDASNPQERLVLEEYIHELFAPHSRIRTELTSKGPLGDYLLSLMISWAERKLEHMNAIPGNKLTGGKMLSVVRDFLTECYHSESSDTLLFILRGLSSGPAGNQWVWQAWNRVRETQPTLSKQEGYEAMLRFLDICKNQHADTQFGIFICDIQLRDTHTSTVNPKYWRNWNHLVEKALRSINYHAHAS